ncbi:hypothetical protein [Heyndrickxia camelliae]|uniref:Uncharacterized protein n=1 Tax=Heyndrickxia camelliae TaxID=1707093 RepID=A0A2N3LCV7_9BACI|nr:hypothetical protein [Heyndrickxia camelliae]PKR82490.1 hypothetical protein CWO92_24120 [Heyndrickxia camelliae]
MKNIEIKTVPETACLMMKLGDELIDYKFYNHFAFQELEQETIKEEIVAMANKHLKILASSMVIEYREKNCFSPVSLEQILQYVNFTDDETGKLIKKFHFINTKIASNGGVPILKEILNRI